MSGEPIWYIFKILITQMSRFAGTGTVDVAHIEDSILQLTGDLRRSFLKSCRVSRPQRLRTVPELRHFRKETSRFFNTAKRTRIYTVSFNPYKGQIVKAKRNYWAKFCKDIACTSEYLMF